MNRTRVKICGFRDAAAVEAAVEAGADALGFNFHPPSPRAVTLAEAAELARAVPPWVARVALLVGADEPAIRAAAEALETRCVQLYGPWSAELLARLSDLEVILAVPARARRTLADLGAEVDHAAALLVDAAAGGPLPGGTGRVADWAEAAAVRAALAPRRLVLAGGLTAANVGEAIRTVRPYAVDVASGVEHSPGCKDSGMMHDFTQAVWESRVDGGSR